MQLKACSGTRGRENSVSVCPMHSIDAFSTLSFPSPCLQAPHRRAWGFTAVSFYLVSPACQTWSVLVSLEEERTTALSKLFMGSPLTFLIKGRGILEWQIKEFMAWRAALNSSVMKARRSITHLLVFLLRWITGSLADSSAEWNENKTIIQRLRVFRKGRKGCDCFQEFRPISVVGHVHLRQEKSSGQCP